jgi:hypothetical protein
MESFSENAPKDLLDTMTSFLPPENNLKLLSRRINRVLTAAELEDIIYLDNNYPDWRADPTPVFRDQPLNRVALVVRILRYNDWNHIVSVSRRSDVVSWAIGKGANNWQIIMASAIKNNFDDIFVLALEHYQDLSLISYQVGYYNSNQILDKLIRMNAVDWVSLANGARASNNVLMLHFATHAINIL